MKSGHNNVHIELWQTFKTITMKTTTNDIACRFGNVVVFRVVSFAFVCSLEIHRCRRRHFVLKQTIKKQDASFVLFNTFKLSKNNNNNKKGKQQKNLTTISIEEMRVNIVYYNKRYFVLLLDIISMENATKKNQDPKYVLLTDRQTYTSVWNIHTNCLSFGKN